MFHSIHVWLHKLALDLLSIDYSSCRCFAFVYPQLYLLKRLDIVQAHAPPYVDIYFARWKPIGVHIRVKVCLAYVEQVLYLPYNCDLVIMILFWVFKCNMDFECQFDLFPSSSIFPLEHVVDFSDLPCFCCLPKTTFLILVNVGPWLFTSLFSHAFY